MVGVDNFTGRRPSLVAEDVLRMQRMMRAGHRMGDVARQFGIHVRSAYRYRHAVVHEVEVAGYRLAFIVWEPGTPPRPIDTRGWHLEEGGTRHSPPRAVAGAA